MRERMRRRDFRRGERLIAQGGPGDALWLLVEGSAQVTLSRGDGEPDQVIGFARAGDVLGETALITREMRSASVHAETDGSAADRLGTRSTDARTDLHAFGCILAGLLLGDVPFSATGLDELIEKMQSFELPDRLRRAASPPLAGLIERLLSPDPGRREIDLAAVEAWAAPIDRRRILAVAKRRAPERIAED